jgi:predicted ATPase/signal transduction histidine kinase
MKIALAGYISDEIIHDSNRTIVYRALRATDRQPVIIKIQKGELLGVEQIARFKQEYKILHQLDCPGVIKIYGLEKFQNKLALILEDFAGISLKDFTCCKQLNLKEFLQIAVQLVTALNFIHQNNIIHKDIKPKNILINPQTGQVKIIDFSIASRLTKESPVLSIPKLLEGTLAYISPEQTGRMNRTVDYRCDLYSLGITFYELLTSSLPFQSTDPLELIHCHIAQQPISPHELKSTIPLVISNLVMKLLAKNAEDRYQSAFGLKSDLELCWQELETTGEIQDFAIAENDKTGLFLIPQKLYGRETEVASLMTTFECVSQGTSEITLVSGYSGIGKSALVNEIYKPIVQQSGYFIKGKFDQFKRDIPYASIIQAFQELIQQLLVESEEKLNIWKQKLLARLGGNGQVIVDVIPELELVIGSQPAIPKLGAAETQIRFNRLFQEFVWVFAQAEHPLVIFLDDLHWADSASLKLIEILMTARNHGYLLLIGAYRDNEVSSTHLLMQTLDKIQDYGTNINNIVLSALKLNSICQLIAETLQKTTFAEPLAELILNKTQGNPFFLTQLLRSLHQEGLIAFDFINNCWLWDIQQTNPVGVTDNVVDLMTKKIQELSQNTQKVLVLAACIGNRFDLKTLAVINEKSLITTASEIWAALQAGLIVPLNNAYKIPLFIGEETAASTNFDDAIFYQFLHDRVQQAAYALIPKLAKEATHLKIGRLLLQSQPLEVQKENVFELVNHLNYGVDLITEQAERDKLAQLNLVAGCKAKNAIAYEPARRYLNTGISLLSSDTWQNQYELTLDLYDATSDLECLSTNYQYCQSLINIALENNQTLLDRVRICKRQIQLYIAQGNLAASIDKALEMLAQLEVFIPTDTNGIDSYCEQLKQKLEFNNNEIAKLIDLPVISNPYKQAAMEILNTMPGPVYIARAQLFMPMMLTMTELSVDYGNSVHSTFGYCIYGLLLCGAWKNIEAGYQFGRLALELLDKFNEKALYCNVMKVYSTHIHPCKNHINSAIELLQLSIESAISTGNVEFLGYGSGECAMYLLFSGENLNIVEQKITSYVEIVESFKQDLGIYYIRIAKQIVLNLIGNTIDPLVLTGESFNETEMLPILIAANWQMLLCCFYLFKLMLAYLFKDYTSAIAYAKSTQSNIAGVLGMMMDYEYNFYHSLTLLKECDLLGESQKQHNLNLVKLNQEVLELKAIYAPMNFQHKYELVEAEKARVLKQTAVAIEYYELSISHAREQGYLQEQALASELAAEFYLALGKEHIAKIYMTDACFYYESWGAIAKSKDLFKRYPQLIIKQVDLAKTPSRLIASATTSTSSESSILLDLATVFKASQAISGEIVLTNLAKKLITIVIESAGAQTGFLVAEKDGAFVIEAAGIAGQETVVLFSDSCEQKLASLPLSIINYVFRSKENVVLNDASRDGIFTNDPYTIDNQPKSVLCMPIIYQGRVSNILYLENNLTTAAFTLKRLEVLRMLSAQIAVSLENAALYDNLAKANKQLENYTETLETTVIQRTQELQEKNNTLEEATTQLKFINQELEIFSSAVSHDLRAPVRRIENFSQMLAQNLGEQIEPASKDYIRRIRAANQQMGRSIEDLLRLSKISHQDIYKQQVDLSAVVKTIADDLQKAELERKVAWQIADSILAKGDRDLIHAVIENLLGNAWKYTRKTLDAVIEFGELPQSKSTYFIRDNGAGFDMNYAHQLFKPFQRLHSASEFEGNGIGLATVQRIVQRHGGKIWAEAEIDRGATFYFTLSS